VSQFVGDGF